MKDVILCIAALFASTALASAQQVAVIAHPANETSSLTSGELEDILLGKRQQWPSGGTVEIAILKTGPVHDDVIRTYAKRSSAQFRTYWRNQVFSGRGVMPQELDDDAAMIRYVANNRGAIGYVDASAVSDSVKVITISP